VIDTIDAADLSDASIRVMQYLHNQFQLKYLDTIDTPFDRRAVDKVINDAQIWLNSLVSEAISALNVG
jgi:hypothetical protein